MNSHHHNANTVSHVHAVFETDMKEGVFDIKKDQDARDAWDMYWGRFYSPEMPQNVVVEFDSQLKSFSPRKNAKAKDQDWRKIKDRDLHSDDFDDFLNGHTIRIPDHITLNSDDLNAVEAAISQGNWQHPLFQKEEHVFYAVWLFRLNKITRAQLTTILARAQIDPAYPISNTYAILDEQGNFTAEAKKCLIPVLENASFVEHFRPEHLERFRLLIKALPKSEQIFYLSGADPRIISGSTKQLGNDLARNASWYRVRTGGWFGTSLGAVEYEFHSSFGVIEAQQIALHGINGACASRAMLGKVSINTVEKGVRSYYRPTAISIKNAGIEAVTEGIHGYKFSPMPVATAHDVFHAKLHSIIPPAFHLLLNDIRDHFKQYFGSVWCSASWEFIDREIYVFQDSEMHLSDTSTANGLYFADMLDHRVLFRTLFVRQHELTNEGIVLLLHMIKHRDTWQKLYKIDIDTIPAPFAGHLKKMRAFVKYINPDDSSTLLNFKYFLFCASPHSDDFLAANAILQSVAGELNAHLSFSKSQVSKRIKNAMQLSFKGCAHEKINLNSKNVLGVLSDFILYKEVNQERIEKLCGEFKEEFKSIVMGSQFVEGFQKNTAYPSLTPFEKIIFLEKCYDAIMQSKYVRRNPITDSVVSFFKHRNPLTTSQRIHIKLLKENLQSVIEAYMQNDTIEKEKKEQFIFAMKHRTSKLMNANIEKFTSTREDASMNNTLQQLTVRRALRV